MKALAMMVEKERGIIDGARFRTLWSVKGKDGTSRCVRSFSSVESFVRGMDLHSPDNGRYRHAITERPEPRKPSPVLGGMLADVSVLSSPLFFEHVDLTRARKWVW